jgi:hypothetical protein
MDRGRRDQQSQREHDERKPYERCELNRQPTGIQPLLKQALKLEAERDLRAEHLHAQLVEADFQQRVRTCQSRSAALASRRLFPTCHADGTRAGAAGSDSAEHRPIE